MDFSKMETSDWLIGGGGIALFVFSFLSWFGKDFDAGIYSASYSESGWSSFFSMIAILLSMVVTGTLIANRLAGVELPAVGSLSWDQLWFFASAGVAGLILLQLLIGSSTGGVSLDRKIGIFLGIIAAAVMAGGGFMKFQAANSGSAGGTTGGGSTPPQPF